ncbi:MAG: S8/S53 family peptidase [Myxococcales bacterium]|nr:S8/S53 family peptidase [Myxococcales bacterium]
MTLRNAQAGLSLALSLGVITGAWFADSAHAQGNGEGTAGAPRFLGHPLMTAPLQDGKLALVEEKNAGNGRRYAVMSGAGQAEEDAPLEVESGVVEISRRRNPAIPAQPVEDTPSKLTRRLRRELEASVDSTGVVRASVALNRSISGYTEALNRAIARHEVLTEGEKRGHRMRYLNARRRDLQDQQRALSSALSALGGVVVSECEEGFCAIVELERDAIESLAANPIVEILDLPTDADPPPDTEQIHGQHASRGTQIYYNFLWNQQSSAPIYYNGWVDGSPLEIAILDNQFNDDHVGFNNNSGQDRIAGRRLCSNGGCATISNFSGIYDDGTPVLGAQHHGTQVAGIVLGTIREGQDSAYTAESHRTQRSGYAGRQEAYLYLATSAGGYDNALGSMDALSSPPLLLSASMGWPEGSGIDDDCDGDDIYSQGLNDLFEDGTLPIRAAGNSGIGSSSDCRVSAPGSARSAFTVGGHTNSSSSGEDDVRYGEIYTSSPRGGTSSEGGNRTIIDITAPACRYRLYTGVNSGSAAYQSSTDCGTSLAAPTVAAAAVDLVDWCRSVYPQDGDLIKEPGVLFANLLLMGDRWESPSSSQITRFSHRTGAGRLKMRRFDGHGMDAPWGWAYGWTCIDHGETYSLSVNSGNTLSTDVEDFKGVIYWYDPSGSVANIDLALREVGGSVLRNSNDTKDNKERVYHSAVGGKRLALEITGTNVPDDNAGCGTNSMKVYYAYFYEDDDRESHENLSWADPE